MIAEEKESKAKKQNLFFHAFWLPFRVLRHRHQHHESNRKRKLKFFISHFGISLYFYYCILTETHSYIGIIFNFNWKIIFKENINYIQI